MTASPVEFPRLATENGEVVVNSASKRGEDTPRHGGPGGTSGGPIDVDPPQRKLAAKRHNEGIKLLGSALTTLGLGVLGFGIVQPLIKDPTAFVLDYRPVWYFVGIGLHIVAQIIIRYEFRGEE